MGEIAAALAVEVQRRVAGVIGGLSRLLVLALEALERSPRLDQRAVHGEVFVRKQPQTARLGDHADEKLMRHGVFQQPRPVTRESRVVEAKLGHIHIEEPECLVEDAYILAAPAGSPEVDTQTTVSCVRHYVPGKTKIPS
jgi:hypothetical protein